VTTHDEYVEVKTSKSVIRAKVLVAADGSRSTIRSKLKWDDESRVARLLEILTPEDPQEHVEFREAQAVFDFTPTGDGLQGYYWDFPSYVNGEAVMNRGVFDSRARPERQKVDLVGELRDSLAERDRDLDDYKLKGHPIRWFDKDGKYAIPRVLLAGDAAGADPLVGEGIAFALAYGDVVATSIIDAFENEDFSFADYGQRIMDHNVLWQLPTRTRLARMAYRWCKYRPIAAIGWRIVGFAIRFGRWNDRDHNPIETPQIVYDS
jgi:flavin-dependent dehydrogenase